MKARFIPHKAAIALKLLLIAFCAIALRVCYLALFKHETSLAQALKPQRRPVVESGERGTIRDRFDLPLAINQLQYNAAIHFEAIRALPVSVREKQGKGKKKRLFKRRLYVEKLSKVLGELLEMESQEIEDLIYSKASLFPHSPYVIRENIPEHLYYRLRMMEREFPGLVAQRGSKRVYPQGRVGADLVGYMGAISERHYLAIAEEIEQLTRFLSEWEAGEVVPLPKGFSAAHEVQERLRELSARAYTIHAQVGKRGIEQLCDEELRGTVGRREAEMGAGGRWIRLLPGGKAPKEGERITLSLSSELQAYAEELLMVHERDRQRHFPLAGKRHSEIEPPWIQGGAIVAMLPQTGEVVALASYPRFDPNDFLEKNEAVSKWLETPRYRMRLFQGLTPLERERAGGSERVPLTWEHYLDCILSKHCAVKRALKNIPSLREAARLCALIEELHLLMGKKSLKESLDQLCKQNFPLFIERQQLLLPSFLPIENGEDRVLFVDLLRLALDGNRLQEKQLIEGGELSLDAYFELRCALAKVEEEAAEVTRSLYHERLFPIWREQHFKAYLSEKRQEEKEKKRYARPFIDYLKEAEKKLFAEFWKQHRWIFLDAFIYGNSHLESELSPFLFHLILCSSKASEMTLKALEQLRQGPLSLSFFKSCPPFEALDAPLFGHYPSLSAQTLQGLATAFYPRHGMGYMKSHAYNETAPLGSLFKIVTGYEALHQYYEKNHSLNPLEIIDQSGKEHLGKRLDGSPILRQYKGGRLPRSHVPVGHVDFQSAMERSSNIYFSLLAGEVIDHPTDLEKSARLLGFGKPTGAELSGEKGGYVPDDLWYNRTGLYSFAIGQHSLIVTPLQSAVMLAAMGNGGKVLKPHLLKKEEPEIKCLLPMPPPVKKELLEALHRVVMGKKGPVHPFRLRTLYEHPEWISTYKRIQPQMVGKTSTAEFAYRPTLDREGGALICKDIWFGALAFEEGKEYKEEMPELAVIVYLRFGDYGKEAAPLAAQIIDRWREIVARHSA